LRADGHDLPRWKKVLFSALMLALVLSAIETVAGAAGSMVTRGVFSRHRLQAQRDALTDSGGRVTRRPDWIQDEIVHPYVGFVPRHRVGQDPFGSRPTGADDDAVVAVVGGSFAYVFAERGLPHLITRLAQLPQFLGKTLVPLNAAAAGHKQPQQAMTVAYLLSLGRRLDIVINLDGFNDVALYPTENAPAGVFPAYPRRWHQRVEGLFPGGALRLMLQRVLYEQRRAALAQVFSRFPWRSLNTANLVYAALDRNVESQLVEADRQLLNEERPATVSSPAAGPTIRFSGDAEMFAYLAGLWRRSSRLLHDVTSARGIRYYHFLQPNQYVPASKPMDPGEKAVAWRPQHPYRRIVETAYPLLREAGRALKADGIRFTDLSAAFADHPESLYVDACCHVNQRGNVIVADLVFDAIRRDLGPD